MSHLILFGSSFALVFLLGLQSLTVNAGHERGAFINSLLIGVANIALLKLAPQANGTEIVAYILGGPLGIIASMRYFKWYRARKQERQDFEAVVKLARDAGFTENNKDKS